MELPNELLHLILTLLDDFTKYRLYTASRSIPYLDRLRIRDCGTIINKMEYNNSNIANVFIKQLTVGSNSILPFYPCGLKTLILTSWEKQPIPSIIIKKLIVKKFFIVSQPFFNQIESLILHGFVIVGSFPILKKLKIINSNHQEIKLSEIAPQLKHLEVVGKFNFVYDNLPDLRVIIKKQEKGIFNLTANITSLTLPSTFDLSYEINNLKKLNFKFAPELYHDQLTHLIITGTTSSHHILDHILDLSNNHNLIYLKLPQVFWIINREKLLNKNLKTLHFTTRLWEMQIESLDKFIMDDFGDWNCNYVSRIEYHNGIHYHMTMNCNYSDLMLPDNLISLKLGGGIDEITLPKSLKKLVLKLNCRTGTINLPSGLRELRARISCGIIFKGSVKLRYLRCYDPILPCDIFERDNVCSVWFR